MPSKLTSRTLWRVKLEKPNVDLPKIVRVPDKWQKRFGTGTMVIARPLDVDSLIRTVRQGKLVTQTQLRERLAKKYHADHTCPLTTGIFVRIIAEVSEEDRRAGKSRVTPYWRVVRDEWQPQRKIPRRPAGPGPPPPCRRVFHRGREGKEATPRKGLSGVSRQALDEFTAARFRPTISATPPDRSPRTHR